LLIFVVVLPNVNSLDMKKVLLALTFSASLFATQVVACGEEKAAAGTTTSIEAKAVSNSGCPHAAKAAADCAKMCPSQAGKVENANASTAQVIAVSNKSGKTCSGGGACMMSLTAAIVAGMGIVGLSLFATKKM
jgi:hypothetical protein